MSAPALLLAIPLIIGVVAGGIGGFHPGGALVVVAIAWLTAATGLWRGWAGLVAAAIAVGSLAAGIALGGAAGRPSPILLSQEAIDSGTPVTMVAVLREDAAATASGLAVSVDAVAINGASVSAGVRVTLAGALADGVRRDWRAGRTVRMTVVLREPLDYRDPGVASDRARLARQGIVLLGSVKSAALTSIIARGSWLSESAATLRARVRAATAASVGPWSLRSAGVVTAILIGDRSGLEPADERRLQEAGTYHVIAISGGNIALLTGLLILAGRLVRLPARATAAASIALLAFYGYAAGLAPSVLRATLAGMVYLTARALDHRGTALNALAVAGSFAAVTTPVSVVDPGFILSFGATAAIVTAATRFRAARHRDRDASRVRMLVRQLGTAAVGLGAATLCAEIALAPVGARLFGRVSVAGLVLNFAAIPLMSIIQVAGLAAVGLAQVWAPAALGCGWIAHAGTSALLRSASLVDVAPWLVVDTPPPAMWVVVAWYAAWAAAMLVRSRAIRGLAAAVIVLCAVTVVRAPPFAAAVRVAPPPDGWTRVAFLDVGQGDATLVVPAGAAPLLVDAGGVPGAAFDLGRRVTLPAAWAFGARRLGALVLTHGDPDHIGGAPAVLRGMAPEEIWEGIPVPRHEPLRQLHVAAAAAPIPWRERHTGYTLTLGSATLSVLNPEPPDWERQKVRNDDSIVLNVRVGDVGILLPGDITRAIEPAVIAGLHASPLMIVKAPHHGSAGSSTPALIAATHPAAVIFSAGRRNPFGHPAPATVQRYEAAGARVFSTADDGVVVVDTDGAKVVIWTWSGRRETFVVPVSRPSAHHEDH